MTSLVVQSFGKENEYKRAVFTVLSFYAFCSLPVTQTGVIFFTDNPEYFKPYFNGLPVQYVLLTEEKTRQMRGTIDFLHRMKIALIEEAFNLVPGKIIYADSDTFFIADPEMLTKQLSPDKSFMHIREYPFENLRNAAMPAGKTMRAFLELIESKMFHLADGRVIKYASKDYSWNAGVMMFHPTQASIIPDVYSLTDQFYPATLSHASEQYAFSLILQERTIVEPCNSVIYHYWYRVKKEIIDSFFEKHINKEWAHISMQKKLVQVKRWCLIMPSYFDKHILIMKDNAIQAFNTQRFRTGYKYALRALIKAPLDLDFIKDVFYHTKRCIKA